MGRPILVVYNLLALYALVAIPCALRAAEPDKKPTPNAITPDLDHYTLEVGGRVLKPVKPATEHMQEYTAGGLSIVLSEKEVKASAKGSDTPQWTVKIPEKTLLIWLAADNKIIYLTGYHVDKESEECQSDSPARVCRLELASGKWLDDLEFNADDLQEPKPK